MAASKERPLRSRAQGHLTDIYGPVDVAASSSFLGQAHFAGTGPAGAKCSQCKFFCDVRERLGRCAEFVRLTGRQGVYFPWGRALASISF